MTKKNYTIFRCDVCEKEETKEMSTGFPYEKGWCYIFNLKIKLLRSYAPAIEIDVAEVELKDRHYCCEKCMEKDISRKIKEAKEIKPISTDEMVHVIKGEKRDVRRTGK